MVEDEGRDDNRGRRSRTDSDAGEDKNAWRMNIGQTPLFG